MDDINLDIEDPGHYDQYYDPSDCGNGCKGCAYKTCPYWRIYNEKNKLKTINHGT